MNIEVVMPLDRPWTVPCLGQEPVAGIDDVHRMLTRDVIGKKLDMVVLRDFTTRLEMTVTPAEYQE